MRLYYPNLVDSYSAISGTSQASASLGYANVAHEHKSKLWRTGTSVADEYVTIDLGSAQSATSAMIFGHTLLNTDSTIVLRKSTDNFAANDVLVGTFTWSAAAMMITFTSTSSRYWRFKFTKASAGVSRDIARLFLGVYVDFTGLPDWDGFHVKVIDPSQTRRAEGGQTYSAIRSQYRKFNLDMTGVTAAQAVSLKTFFETVGAHTPFFLTADTAATDESGEILYVKATNEYSRDARGMDSSALAWQAPVTAEEQL